jgi:hypothetical protein
VKPLLWSLIAVPWCEKFHPLNAAGFVSSALPRVGQGGEKGGDR